MLRRNYLACTQDELTVAVNDPDDRIITCGKRQIVLDFFHIRRGNAVADQITFGDPMRSLIHIGTDGFFQLVFQKMRAHVCYHKKIRVHQAGYMCQKTPISVSFSFVFDLEFITDAPDGGKAPLWMIFDFFTQTFDMYIYGSGIANIFISPDMVKKLLSG